MKARRAAKSLWIGAAGALIGVAAVLVYLFWATPLSPLMRILLGVSAFVGFSSFGHHGAELILRRMAERDPEAEHELSVAQSDERNRTIKYMAESKAFNVMSELFGLLIMVYAVLQVGTWFLAGLIAAFLLSQGAMVYFLLRLHRQM